MTRQCTYITQVVFVFFLFAATSGNAFCWGSLHINYEAVVEQGYCPGPTLTMTKSIGASCTDGCGYGHSTEKSATGFGQCISGTPNCDPFACRPQELVTISYYNPPRVYGGVLNRRGWYLPLSNCTPECESLGRSKILITCPCDEDWTPRSCVEQDPLIVSLYDRRYLLTDRAGGVEFDLGSDGELERVPWTRPGADDAYLALDRDGNGTIDNGRELFGDLTPQHGSPDPNGFLALALFDDIFNGGNEDGRISADDMIFEHLLLWHDENHNGYSESEELLTLGDVGIEWFDLDFQRSGRIDQFGNAFRYWAKSGRDDGSKRTVWNVFFPAP